MKRRSRIITFFVVGALTYGSLFAIVGPEKVREWHKSHRFHRDHHYHHDHHGHHNDDHGELKDRDAGRESENL